MTPSLDTAFALQPLGEGQFRAATVATDERRVFGGLLLAQALAASAATVEGVECHSLHALFTAAAKVDQPLDFRVSKLRDGRKFFARRVEGWQGDRLILAALASFHAGDNGPAHAVAMPVLPQPEDLPVWKQVESTDMCKQKKRRYVTDVYLDVRPVEMPLDRSNGVQGQRAIWFKPRGTLPEGRGSRRNVLAFASDMGLVHVGLQPHKVAGNGAALETSSLDHTIWFHRDPPAEDWLVHVQRGPVAFSGRGTAHGHIFTREGILVATTAQEFLCREKGMTSEQDLK